MQHSQIKAVNNMVENNSKAGKTDQNMHHRRDEKMHHNYMSFLYIVIKMQK